jgi:hypothetical protein
MVRNKDIYERMKIAVPELLGFIEKLDTESPTYKNTNTEVAVYDHGITPKYTRPMTIKTFDAQRFQREIGKLPHVNELIIFLAQSQIIQERYGNRIASTADLSAAIRSDLIKFVNNYIRKTKVSCSLVFQSIIKKF